MTSRRSIILATCAAILAALGFPAHGESQATATMRTTDGRSVGEITLSETPHGVLVEADLRNLPPGEHGFHIHAIGECDPTPEPPNSPFSSAGGHFAPLFREHGVLDPMGKHAGDLPNIHVPESGMLRIEVFADAVTLARDKVNSLLDNDGSAIVIHAEADDYRSNPSGAAGPRIACGVITP